MEFKTYYDDREPVYTEHGSPFRTTYHSYIDKKGNVLVEEKGKEDQYAFIQSFADECDINNVIERFANTGDEALLNKRIAEYVDLTEYPKDWFEMVNMINDSKDFFNKLPVDIKQKFDNDPNKFLVSTGSADWYAKLVGPNISMVDADIHGNLSAVGQEDVVKGGDIINATE